MKAFKVILVLALLSVAGYIYLQKKAKTEKVAVTAVQLIFPAGAKLTVIKPVADSAGFGKAPIVFYSASDAPVAVNTYEQGDVKSFMVESGKIQKIVAPGSVAFIEGGDIKTSGKYTDKDIANENSLKLLAAKLGINK